MVSILKSLRYCWRERRVKDRSLAYAARARPERRYTAWSVGRMRIHWVML